MCKRGEVEELFNADFYELYELWSNYKMFGLSGELENYDPDKLRTILEMEFLYKRYFSTENTIIQYLESIIKVLKTGFRIK